MDLEILRSKKVGELREIAKALHIKGAASMKKQELFDAISALAIEAEREAAEKEKAEKAAEAEAAKAEEQAEAKPETAPEAKPAEKPEPKAEKKKRGRRSAKKAETADTEAVKAEEQAEEKPAAENEAPIEAKTEAVKAEEPEEKAEAKAEKPGAEPAKQPEQRSEKKKRGRKPAKKTGAAGEADEKMAPQKAETEEPAEEMPQSQEITGEKPVIGPSSIVTIEVCGEEGEQAEEDDAPAPAEKHDQPQTEKQEKAEKPAEPQEAADNKKKDRRNEPQKDGRYETRGILEITDQGYGFLRFDNFESSDQDIYVSPVQIRRFNLKTGDMIECVARVPNENDKFGALLFVRTVNGEDLSKAIHRKDFSDLTPTYPEERITLEKGSSVLSMRMTDLVAPIGKGQRGLIVAPPKAGKTTILKQIAQSIENQDVGAELIVLLIDERPEEVTDMKRSIKGQVIYSTFDEQPAHHVKVAEMVLARAQRLAEHGKDVIILLDSITRLARAYNLVEPPSGRTLSGGLDPAALYKPKKFFGAARNTAEGGSITILATALIETGSRMDDMIFEEFKGTGNMELHLDRKLSEKRIFPAINLNKSGTRREDMLMSSEELEAVWLMRRAVADMGIQDATERIVFELVHSKTNNDFINRIRKIRLV